MQLDIRSIIKFLTIGIRGGSISPGLYRLAPQHVEEVSVNFIGSFNEIYNFLIFVSSSISDEKLIFFESLYATRTPSSNARILGEMGEISLVDAFSDVNGANRLMNISQDYENGSIKAGIILERNPNAENIFPFSIMSVESLAKARDVPTTNLIYIWMIENVTFAEPMKIVVKKYIPRFPADRGTWEYELLRYLSFKQRAPRIYGALKIIDWEVIAVFQQFIGNVNNVETDIQEKISKLRNVSSSQVLLELQKITNNALTNVIYPLHRSTTRELKNKKLFKRGLEVFEKEVIKEIEKGLELLRELKILKGAESREIEAFLKNIWTMYVSKRPSFIIHNDLSWHQIFKDNYGRYLLIDLDNSTYGHIERDIAYLCTANTYIADSVDKKIHDKAKSLINKLNTSMIEDYFKLMFGNDDMEKQDYKLAILFYLAVKYLNDSAYYAPLKDSGEDFENFMKRSLSNFRKTLNELKKCLSSKK